MVGEWLRKASSPSWLRLLDMGDEDGGGDELGILRADEMEKKVADA